MKFKDLTGHRFGMLTVIKRAENRRFLCGRTLVSYLCRCDCGEEKNVLASNLLNGHTKSCGCIQKQSRVVTHTKHGSSQHRLYTTWTNIKQRCGNPNSDDYKNYGGRGITVCDEWKNDFQTFYDWAMANGYEDHLTIDRIDVNGNYCPENCRWVTRIVQRHNRRDSNIRGK